MKVEDNAQNAAVSVISIVALTTSSSTTGQLTIACRVETWGISSTARRYKYPVNRKLLLSLSGKVVTHLSFCWTDYFSLKGKNSIVVWTSLGNLDNWSHYAQCTTTEVTPEYLLHLLRLGGWSSQQFTFINNCQGLQPILLWDLLVKSKNVL